MLATLNSLSLGLCIERREDEKVGEVLSGSYYHCPLQSSELITNDENKTLPR